MNKEVIFLVVFINGLTVISDTVYFYDTTIFGLSMMKIKVLSIIILW